VFLALVKDVPDSRLLVALARVDGTTREALRAFVKDVSGSP
jgi:RNase P/RNase MRP subunit POP5